MTRDEALSKDDPASPATGRLILALVAAVCLPMAGGTTLPAAIAAVSAATPVPTSAPASPRSSMESMVSIRHFDGRPIVPVRTLRMRVTAYSPDERSCGRHADGITSSGYSVETNGGHLVAADSRWFPFGSLISIPGYADGQVVPVLDRGGAIRGNRIDVLYPDHEMARGWGVQYIHVTEWAYDDGEAIRFQRPH